MLPQMHPLMGPDLNPHPRPAAAGCQNKASLAGGRLRRTPSEAEAAEAAEAEPVTSQPVTSQPVTGEGTQAKISDLDYGPVVPGW